MKKVFLDDLPHKNGVGVNKNRLLINWENSINHTVNFVYEKVKGTFLILNYYKENNKSYCDLKYKNKRYKVSIDSIKNCLLGNIVGTYHIGYRYNVGDIIQTNSSRIQILDQKRKKSGKNQDKSYKYVCLKCGKQDEILERLLTQGHGCKVCNNQQVLKGHNDMWTTNPKVAKLLVNPEDGYKYTYGSTKKVLFQCPDCGNTILKPINRVNLQGLSCPKCSDGISYPNKFIFSLLQQLLKNDFDNEKIFLWSNSKRYDFYFEYNNEKYIIEANGLQHYEGGFGKIKGARTLVEEQENDRLKKIWLWKME